MNRGRWQQNHWSKFDRLTADCPMALSSMATMANQKWASYSGPALHIIKSTPAWWRWCLEFALKRWKDNNCGHLATFWTTKNRLRHDYLHWNIPECFPGRRTTDQNLTLFSVWSCFLVLRRGETSPHPHKETLLARLLTRTQEEGNIWASLKTCRVKQWQNLICRVSRDPSESIFARKSVCIWARFGIL